MPKFRKKPVVVDAEQYTEFGQNIHGICGDAKCEAARYATRRHIHTIDGGQANYLQVGDWVLSEPGGEYFRLCSPAGFEIQYEPAP